MSFKLLLPLIPLVLCFAIGLWDGYKLEAQVLLYAIIAVFCMAAGFGMGTAARWLAVQ